MSDKHELIHKKIPKIMSEMNAIGKDSRNTQQNFNYRSIDAVYGEFQKRMAIEGIFSAPTVLSCQ